MAPDEAAEMAWLEAYYQTHCALCFTGCPDACTGGPAPNGQPCATTPAQVTAWIAAHEPDGRYHTPGAR